MALRRVGPEERDGSPGRRRLLYLVPLALIAAVLILPVLAALVDLPGEQRVRNLLGQEPDPCVTRHAGSYDEWRGESPLPSLRDEPRAALVGDEAILIGGIAELRSEDGSLVTSIDTVEAYDYETGRWRSLPSLPMRLNHVGVAVHEGRVYVAGGFLDQLEPLETTDRMFRYDPQEEAWEELEPMPTTRGGHGLAVVEDTLYAVGGLNADGNVAEMEAYDITEGSWSTRARMPNPRDHLGVAALGGHVYAVAGRHPGAITFGDAHRYDPRSDAWEELPALPEVTSGNSLTAVNGRLVVMGGEVPLEGHVTGAVWSYAPGDDNWTQMPSMPQPKHGHTALARDGRVQVFGGSECLGFSPTRTSESLPVGS